MAEDRQQMRRDVESLKHMLVARATGGATEGHYPEVRRRIVQNPIIARQLPEFVHTCHTLDEFWGMIQPKFATYAERREFLRKEFEPVLSFLEQSARTPADAVAAG